METRSSATKPQNYFNKQRELSTCLLRTLQHQLALDPLQDLQCFTILRLAILAARGFVCSLENLACSKTRQRVKRAKHVHVRIRIDQLVEILMRDPHAPLLESVDRGRRGRRNRRRGLWVTTLFGRGWAFSLGFSEFSQRFEARFDCFSEKADLRRSK